MDRPVKPANDKWTYARAPNLSYRVFASST